MARERREHRVALEILYAVEVGGRPLDEAMSQARTGEGVFARGDRAIAEDPYEPLHPAIDRRADAPTPTEWTLVERIVHGSLAHKAELEPAIAGLLQRWRMERLAGVDRMILLMATWELRHRKEADTAEIINHAVELARRLSTEKSAGFVNAILDAAAKTPVPAPPGDAG